MLKELQIGKIYHVKDYDTLIKERTKYCLRYLRNVSNSYIKKASFIAGKEVQITQIWQRHCVNAVIYAKEVSTYSHSVGLYAIFPHEVIEFDSTPNLDIF